MRTMMRNERNTWAATAINEIFGIALILAAIAFLGVGFLAPVDFSLENIPTAAWLAMAFSAISWGWTTYITYEIYRHLEAGEVKLFTQAYYPFVIVFGVALFGDKIGLWQFAGMLLIFAGMAVSTFRGNLPHISKKLWLLIALNLSFTFLTISDKFAIAYFPPLLYSLPMFFVPMALAVFATLREKPSELVRVAKQHWLSSLAIAATNICAFVGVLMGFRLMPVSISSTIVGTQTVLAVLLGAMLLGERDRIWWKIAGALLAFAGVAMISG